MEFTFISNACSLVKSGGFTFLTDPWLADGVFDGAWFPAAPLRSRLAELVQADAIYVSHLHEDHCDREFLQDCPKDKRLYILDDGGPNYLRKVLERNGFRNLHGLKDGEPSQVGPFQIRIFRPFDKNIFQQDVAVGNLIDSAILFEADGQKLLNTNDNNPTQQAAEQFGKMNIDLVLLNYGSAGAYPSCFPQLSHEQKLAERRRILVRNMNHWIDLANKIAPRCAMQFAGDYILGGKNFDKNIYLAGQDQELFESILDARGPLSWKLLSMVEGQVFDLGRSSVSGGTLPGPEAEQRYRETVRNSHFPYEEMPDVQVSDLARELQVARERLRQKAGDLRVFNDLKMYIRTNGGFVRFNFRNNDMEFGPGAGPAPEAPYLEAELDSRLFKEILTRKTNWNNAQIGCHIDFRRDPNVWIPDVDTLMSFFRA